MDIGLITDEPGRYYEFRSILPSGEYFQFRPRNPPLNSKPIVDDESGMYRLFRRSGSRFMADL